MVMQISNSTASAAVSGTPTRSPEQQAFKDLRQALRNGDLDAAKQAYGDILRNAPAGKTWNPDSAFAQVGKALVAGNLDAAKSAYAAMIQSRNGGNPPVTSPGASADASAASTTPGQVNLVA
jgi:hypothetical protein